MPSSVHKRLSLGSQPAQEEVRANEKLQWYMAVLQGEVSGTVSKVMENCGCSQCVLQSQTALGSLQCVCRLHTQREILGCPLSVLWGSQTLGIQYLHLESLCLLQPVWSSGGCQ